ncbi:MAG: alkaline phosphatase family protein [Terriglobales bacterium]
MLAQLLRKMRAPQKTLLIGWDAADWKIITPLLDQGLMPTLENFVNHGVMGNLATLHPILSPMLWNSIATGKRRDKHGIHGFVEPDPQTGGVRPVSSTSRKVKAIWNILMQRGYKTHVLGWFAGHPAEPINGVSVSDLYPSPVAPLEKLWPLPPGAVHPESMREAFAALRMHPEEVTDAAILPWIPRAAGIDQEKDNGLQSFAKILARISIRVCRTCTSTSVTSTCGRKESTPPSAPSSTRLPSTAIARRRISGWPWPTCESGAMSKPLNRHSMRSDCNTSFPWATFIWEWHWPGLAIANAPHWHSRRA